MQCWLAYYYLISSADMQVANTTSPPGPSERRGREFICIHWKPQLRRTGLWYVQSRVTMGILAACMASFSHASPPSARSDANEYGRISGKTKYAREPSTLLSCGQLVTFMIIRWSPHHDACLIIHLASFTEHDDCQAALWTTVLPHVSWCVVLPGNSRNAEQIIATMQRPDILFMTGNILSHVRRHKTWSRQPAADFTRKLSRVTPLAMALW